MPRRHRKRSDKKPERVFVLRYRGVWVLFKWNRWKGFTLRDYMLGPAHPRPDPWLWMEDLECPDGPAKSRFLPA